MSSRADEKHKRKVARLEAERAAAASERRSRRLRLVLGGAVGLLAAGGVAVALAAGGSSGGPSGDGMADAFGPHYDRLAERLEQAQVLTMATGNGPTHIHPRLSVWADGESVAVPVNIGIAPDRPGADMAALHTHEPDGTIHVEGQPDATLGQFFSTWGVPFGENRLGPYRQPVRMWVDGEPSQALGQLALRDGQRITVAVGSPDPADP